jgi:hypothetical protein
MSYLKRLGNTLSVIWASPLFAMVAAFIVYMLIILLKGGGIFRETPNGYYPYLADAFNHGQLNLRLIPNVTLDLVSYHGKFYLYWPPLPAVLMMPLVAVLGVNISDIFMVMLVAVMNVGMVALLLKRLDQEAILSLDPARRGLLVLFFIAGSVQFPLALKGAVWATGQLIGFFFVALSYITAIIFKGRRAFLLTGLAISCAAATRNSLIFTGIWPAFFLLTTHWKLGWKKLAAISAVGLLPVLLTIAGLAWYNLVRFGSITDFGLAYHKMSNFFRADYLKYGVFNLHYVGTNLFYQYIYYPFPWSDRSVMGGSLFLLSPILFGAFFGLFKGSPKSSVLFLILSIFISTIPTLLLMGTGWIQIGPRYTLDYHIPLIMLTAMGIKRWPVWLISLLVLLSCLQYIVAVFM